MSAVTQTAELPPDRRPVISGIGCFTPAGRSRDELCESILAGRDSIAPVTGFSTDGFVSDLASAFPAEVPVGMPDREKQWMDRASWFAVEAVREALTHAEVDLQDIDRTRIAVVLGSSHSGLVRTEDVARAVINKCLAEEDKREIFATLVSHCTAVVSNMVGALGPRLTISSACASSNTAVGCAADMICNGEADVVITGGAETVSLSVMAGFNSLRALGKTKTAPFSIPLGLNLGEGAGILVVESLARVQGRGKRPVAEILGYGLSGDAHHPTAPDPGGRGAEQAMREALRQAGVTPGDISYISAHGTGTDANDRAESLAYQRLFGEQTPISSVKSYIGHTLGASGVLELIISLLAAEKGVIPPGLHFQGVRPDCAPLDYVANVPRPAAMGTIICNNFGFGGNNSSLVVSREISPSRCAAQRLAQVAVVGRGLISAAGPDTVAFCDVLHSGRSALTKDPVSGRWIGQVAPLRFTDPALRPFARSSPMIKYAIKAVGEAIGTNRDLVHHNPEAGLIMGVTAGAQQSTEKFMESVLAGDPALASAHHFPMTTMNAAGGQVSITYGLTGYTTTFCGSPSAFLYACDLVRSGRQRIVIAGAADEVTPTLLDIYAATGALSDDRAESFANEPGFTFGEAGAAIMLEDSESAEARGAPVLAFVSGWAETQDATKIGINLKGEGLTRAIRRALDRADLAADDIDAVIAYGVGPGHFHRAERRALNEVFGAYRPPVRSAAGLIGYGPSSFPLVSLVAGISVLCTQKLPPTSDLFTGAVAEDGERPMTHVLVAGSDITGIHSAVVLTRARGAIET